MYNPTLCNPDDYRAEPRFVEPSCPWCHADGEDMRCCNPRNVYDLECAQCGCTWDERTPDTYTFVYDDPREVAQ